MTHGRTVHGRSVDPIFDTRYPLDMLKWTSKSFHELTVDELYALLMLRSEIFVVEQACIFNDLDGFDKEAIHIMGWLYDSGGASSEKLVAYARTYGPYNAHVHARDKPECSIGRVVIDKKYRSLGYGRALMQEAIQWCVSSFPDAPIRIGAQCHLDKFYSELGFCREGDEYDEDGIKHVDMVCSGLAVGLMTNDRGSSGGVV